MSSMDDAPFSRTAEEVAQQGVRRPWQSPELVKETVEAATANGGLLKEIQLVEVVVLLGPSS
jgi:hypothetical protein